MLGQIKTILSMFGGGRQHRTYSGNVDPLGPVFISYRQSDGSELAAETAWAFRAAGVPVWHDESDLPPGDTERRLSEALESGLSGAVLLVTPEIQLSDVVRNVELPRLLALEKDPRFTFSVLSVIERTTGKLDYDAPDKLLSQPAGTLSRLKQEQANTAGQRAQAARAHSQRRMHAVNECVVERDRSINIDVQTRIPPFAARVGDELVLRLRPPNNRNRRPNYQALWDLKHFLAGLPQLLALAGAEHARVKGGAHLSVAYAIGAAMPTTLIGLVEVLDTNGNKWSLAGPVSAANGSNQFLNIVSSLCKNRLDGPILVYLDLTPDRHDAAFHELATEDVDRFAAAFHIRAIQQDYLSHEDATEITREASMIIRELAGKHRTSEVHLLLKCPWTIALLLGRTSNTLRVHLYEWEDGVTGETGQAKPRYLPSLVVRSGVGAGPIETVTLPIEP